MEEISSQRGTQLKVLLLRTHQEKAQQQQHLEHYLKEQSQGLVLPRPHHLNLKVNLKKQDHPQDATSLPCQMNVLWMTFLLQALISVHVTTHQESFLHQEVRLKSKHSSSK